MRTSQRHAPFRMWEKQTHGNCAPRVRQLSHCIGIGCMSGERYSTRQRKTMASNILEPSPAHILYQPA